MPSKRNVAGRAERVPELNVPKELPDQPVTGPMTQGDLESMFRSLQKAVIKRAMTAEMMQHLGDPRESRPEGLRNHRNGARVRSVITDDGPAHIDVPRDRTGRFEPPITGKHKRRFSDLNQQIVAMYARRSQRSLQQKSLDLRRNQGFAC